MFRNTRYILDDETYKKTVLTDKKYGLWMGEKVHLHVIYIY